MASRCVTAMALVLLAAPIVLATAAAPGTGVANRAQSLVAGGEGAEGPSLGTVAGYDFGMMIDAGSTGSRLHIFKWPTRVFGTVPPPLTVPVTHQLWSLRKAPGISTGAEGLEVLKELITFAKQVLTPVQSNWGNLPIFLKATAGMRVLPTYQVESIMADVRQYLGSTPFKFKPDWARVISGEEEGVYGWLTVNYLSGALQGKAPLAGALDLGGASTQITFRPNVDIMANLFNVQLGSAFNKNTYTHSFLYFGQNEAARRVSQAVTDNQKPVNGAYQHPCLPTGYTTTFVTLQGVNVTLTGSGSYAQCKAYTDGLMFKKAVCLTNPNGMLTGGDVNQTCSIAGVYQPPVYGNFVAFSGFSHVTSFLKLSPTATLAQLRAAVTPVCETSWDNLKHSYPKVPVAYLYTYCGTSAFAESLLGLGYGFSDDTTSIRVAADSEGISYALGSMLFEANSLGWSFDGKTSKEPFIALFAAFAAAFVVAAIVAFVMWRKASANARARPQLQQPLV